MHASQFTRYLVENERYLPRALFMEVKRAARDRVIERLQAGRADSELTFNDLFERCEASIAPK